MRLKRVRGSIGVNPAAGHNIMKKRNALLLIDAGVNLILGLLLIAYSTRLAEILGVPITEQAFYPSILGAVLVGIALALLAETFGATSKFTSGLGLFGAILINLCGGIVLLYWLLSGSLNLPLRGRAFLWGLDLILLIVSCLELINHIRLKK